jgi:thiol:disulfide interchange protein DsbD
MTTSRALRALAALTLTAAATITTSGLAPEVARADFLGDVSTQFTDALGSGNYLLAFGFIYLVGLGTALTPCVYPMIAITVSVFGAREAKSKAEAALLSTVFVLGIATPFVPLGIFVGLTGGVFGAWLANPIVLVAFALLFTALAASMFGAFELDLPPALKERFTAVEGGVGFKGAFALGFVCAFIAAPCTGPAIVGLLTYIGQTHDVVLGGAGMFVVATGGIDDDDLMIGGERVDQIIEPVASRRIEGLAGRGRQLGPRMRGIPALFGLHRGPCLCQLD